MSRKMKKKNAKRGCAQEKKSSSMMEAVAMMMDAKTSRGGHSLLSQKAQGLRDCHRADRRQPIRGQATALEPASGTVRRAGSAGLARSRRAGHRCRTPAA